MTASRSTKEEYIYRKLRHRDRNSECPFCAIKKGDSHFVDETKYYKIIRNRTPYSLWDGQGVVDHLMVVPKKHTDRLGDVTSEGAVEYLKIIDRYESDGYNLYARAPGSNVKSVVHQHTHLLKIDGKNHKFLLQIKTPFYLRARF